MLRSWSNPKGCSERSSSADPNLVVGDKLVGRQRKIGRRRAAADPSRGVVLRAMTRAEPAVIVTLMGERNAAEMRADTDQHQPLIVTILHTGLVRLRIRQALPIHTASLV